MARVPYPDLNAAGDDLQTLVSQIREERGGRLLNLYHMLLNSPPLAAGWLHLLTAVRYQGMLEGNVRELAICLVARLTKADYEWQAHARLALLEGISQAQLDALPNWRDSDLFDPRHRALLAYAEQSTTQVCVDDATFAGLRESFNAREIVELTITVGAYNMVSRLLVAMEIDPESSP